MRFAPTVSPFFALLLFKRTESVLFSHATYCAADGLGRLWERERVPGRLWIPALVIYPQH